LRSHDEIRLELPAFAASRLGDADCREVETHLVECAECRELADTCREIVAAVRDGGEALFDPHPGEEELREFALERSTKSPRIAGHLAACATCALEVQAWRAGRPGSAGSRSTGGNGRPWRAGMFALGSAAGLLAGMGVAFLLRTGSPEEAVRRASPPEPAPAAHLLAGLAPVPRFLPGLLRGEVPAATWRIGEQERWIGVGVPLVLPESTSGAAQVRFELLRESGAAAWSTRLTAEEVLRHLDAADLVSLVLPTEPLESGRCEFRVTLLDGANEIEVYRARVEISREQ
jgi:hypothetical protein